MFLASVRASADPIQVTGGQLTNALFGAQFTFTGEGFSLSAFPQGGLPSLLFLDCKPCRSEAAVPLSFDAAWPGGSLSSGLPGQFDGVTYERTFLDASFAFDGAEFTSAVLSPTNLTLTAPFSMTATLRNYATSSRIDPPLFTASLTGFGTATARFTTVEDGLGGRLFDVSTVTYEFAAPAATPEPGTLLLLGTGIAAVVRRRMRKT